MFFSSEAYPILHVITITNIFSAFFTFFL